MFLQQSTVVAAATPDFFLALYPHTAQANEGEEVAAAAAAAVLSIFFALFTNPRDWFSF